MANALFDTGREGILKGEITWQGTTVKMRAYLGRGYTFNAAHKFVSDYTGNSGVVVATVELATLTYANGVAGCAGWTWPAVGAGSACTQILLVQYTDLAGGALADSARRLIAFIDTATGLPVTPNGGDITGAQDAGANKLFKL
jgi:hypothetical protein